MEKRTFELKNALFGKSVEVFYNDKDLVIKAYNHAGVLVIDDVVYDGDTLMRVGCPNYGCTFTRQEDGTYHRSNYDEIYTDLQLLQNGVLLFRDRYGQHSFGAIVPEHFGLTGRQHRCTNGQCYEQKSFDTFKRFWSYQDKAPLPTSIWHTSLHEAAHAVMAVSLGLRVKELTIVGTEEYRGCVTLEPHSNNIARVDVALAGFVLDQACRVSDTGANKDLIDAFKSAIIACALDPKALLESDFMVGEITFTAPSLIAECIHEHPQEKKADTLVSQSISAVLMELSGLADQIVAVASCAYDKKTIEHEEIERIMNTSSPALAYAFFDQGAELASAFSDLQLAIRKDKTLPT